jgi:hypothetical protein
MGTVPRYPRGCPGMGRYTVGAGWYGVGMNEPSITPASLIPITRLRPWKQPRSPESQAQQVAFLAACFRDLGEKQLVPIIAMADGRIVDGHCRFLALREAGVQDVRVVGWSGKKEPTDEQVARINATQSAIPPAAETLEKWRRLVDEHGWTVERLAEAVGKSSRTLREEIAAWRNLPDAAKAQAKDAGASKAEILKAAKGHGKRPAGSHPPLGTGGGDDEPPVHPPVAVSLDAIPVLKGKRIGGSQDGREDAIQVYVRKALNGKPIRVEWPT